MQQSFAFVNRVAWCVSAMLVLSAASGWAQSPPTLPPRYAESPGFRARLSEAAADSTLEPWQREFMQGLVGAGVAPRTSAATREASGAADVNGYWDKLPPPTARYGHTAIYDPGRDCMVVFGGYDGSSYRGDVWVLNLAGPTAWSAPHPSGTSPSARSGHSAIYDPVRDRMIVFGGYDGSAYCNDVWALNLAGAPTWTSLSPTGAPPAARNLHTAIYDPVRDRMIVFGGYGGGVYRNDVWTLSLAGTPEWSALSPTGTLPTARIDHSAIYDPVRDRMIVFGGYGGGVPRNDVWALSLTGASEWSALSPTGRLPASRTDHSAIYDPVEDRMVVFGGQSGSAHNDVWALRLAGTPAWSALSPTGVLPTARFAHTAIYDAVRDRMIMFGGSAASALNDTWAFNLAGTPAWDALSPVGEVPDGRIWHASIHDPVRDRLIVFGGFDGVANRNDVWALSLAGTPAWSALEPTGTPPSARRSHSAVYDPVRDRMIVFGGYDGTALRNDVWALSLAGTPAWSVLSPTGVLPAPREDHSAIYDPLRDRMLVFGGSISPGFSNEVWALSLAGVPAWSALDPAGAPPSGRGKHSSIYDPAGDRMVVFGGVNALLHNDVWALGLAGPPEWSNLSPMGVLPDARFGHTAVYDPVRNRMVVFGGILDGYIGLGDVWALGLVGTPTWNALSPTGSAPPPLADHSAIYDPARDRMIVFGGSFNSIRNDVYRLNWESTAIGVQQTAITDFHLGSPFPNPTREAIAIRFDLPAEMPVWVAVYDVAGRLVQRVADRSIPAGTHTLNWAMGRGGGRQVPPGLYYCRVRLGKREFTRTVVVVR